MIAFLEEARRGEYLALAAEDPVLGARLHTVTAAYGLGGLSAGHWLALGERGDSMAALLRFGGGLSLACRAEADIAEVASFVQAVGGIRWVEAAPEVTAFLGDKLGGKLLSGPVMAFDGPGQLWPEARPDPRLEGVYRLMRQVFRGLSPWEEWYPHASHVLRHRLGFVAAVYDGERIVGTGGVWTTGAGWGVISGVAVESAHRGRGFGSRLVLHLCAECRARDLQPVLCCDADLAGFYRRLGFVPRSRWSRLEFG